MKYFNVLQRNYQLLLALVLVVFVPTALLALNYFTIKKAKENLDVEIDNKITLSTNIAKNYIQQAWPDKQEVQDRVLTIVNENRELKALDVLVPEGDNFKIIASISERNKGKLVEDPLNNIAWKEGALIFSTNAGGMSSDQSLESYDYQSGARYQMIARTLENSQGEKVALLSAKVSSEQIKVLTQELIFRSYFFSGLIILAILILIATNFKLFQEAAVSNRLKEVDRMKDEFISIASHELRAPLTAVKGYVSMMSEDIEEEETENLNEYIESITAATDRLGHLVEDILDVSRIEQNRIDINWEELDPGQIIEEVINQFKFRAKEKGLKLYSKEAESEAKQAVISADKNRFTQVITNLVSNAIKYTPSGEVAVKLQLDEEKKNVLIKVRDSGIGMSAQERKKLFKKFSRIKNKTTSQVVGTGLGLWITKRLVDLQKGEIWVDSIEGEGSEFTVKMPVKKFEKEESKENSNIDSKKKKKKKKKKNT
ncbi:MAG: sensor histidine kinase [Patescibacteria group bacterium]